MTITLDEATMRKSYHDMVGQRFGRLIAMECVERVPRDRWRCQCDCGNETTLQGKDLRSGHTRGCSIGCRLRYPPMADRFFAMVDLNGPTMPHMDTPCHMWTGYKRHLGYGGFKVDVSIDGRGRMELAHRVAFFIADGRWPEPFGLHHCDNPPCVRRSHLYEGDDKANAADRVARGRVPSGEGHWSHKQPDRVARGESKKQSAKLTEADVREILRLYRGGKLTQLAIGRLFGVRRNTVSRIVTGRRWAHVS